MVEFLQTLCARRPAPQVRRFYLRTITIHLITDDRNGSARQVARQILACMEVA